MGLDRGVSKDTLRRRWPAEPENEYAARMNWAPRGGFCTAVVFVSGVCAAIAPACHRHEDGRDAPSPSAPAAVDRLAPGELVDGPLRAFDVKLPQGMQIREAFGTVIYAWGPVDPMRLANYLRAQVKGGSISVGAAATVFDQVTVSADTKRILRLRVDAAGQGRAAHLEVRDVTPPPPQPAADDAERWKRAGLTPDGKLLDPAHLH